MPTLTLKENLLLGDFFQPPNPQQQGDPWLIIERVLEDTNGNQVGTATVRGTFMKVDPPDDLVISTSATNRSTGIPGRNELICTQGLFRCSDLANPVLFAMVGGTEHYKNARGTLTVIFATHTPVFDYLG